MYIRPVGENEAVALIRAKDYAGAKAAYEDALKERPNSGFALYGLAHVRELSGDAPGAREGYQAFLKAWSAADPTLPEVVHARKIVDEYCRRCTLKDRAIQCGFVRLCCAESNPLSVSPQITCNLQPNSEQSQRCAVRTHADETTRGVSEHMSNVRVLVGTRKGAFILTSDGKRDNWQVSGPHFAGWEIYHMKGSPVGSRPHLRLANQRLVRPDPASLRTMAAKRGFSPASSRKMQHRSGRR